MKKIMTISGICIVLFIGLIVVVLHRAKQNDILKFYARDVAWALTMEAEPLIENTKELYTSAPDTVKVLWGDCVAIDKGGHRKHLEKMSKYREVAYWGMYGTTTQIQGKQVIVTFELIEFLRPNVGDTILLTNPKKNKWNEYKSMKILGP